MKTKQLIMASNNKHKIDEIRSMLGQDWDVLGANRISPGLTWDETGATFLENARIKINALRLHTSQCILADDSGLVVDALNGRPGVYSSSFGGVEGDHSRNVDFLLKELKDIPLGKRSAHFYCLLLFVDEQGRESLFEGRCFGSIAMQRTGDHGFGYDPVFIPDGHSISMAQMSHDEKNAISHRGLAMSKFIRAMIS